jgi:DNA-binding LytR/AlgR family response regulator
VNSLRVLLVDDEPLALRRLEILIQNIEGVESCGTASGCKAAVEATGKLNPDVVLLDIRMRDGTGFDYLASLPDGQVPAIIFVTAFDSHAVEAFTHEAIDYVLKPINIERLVAALDRARLAIEHRSLAVRMDEMKAVIGNLRAAMRSERTPNYETEIWVRKRVTGFQRIVVDEIEWISAEDDYVRLNLSGQAYLLRSTLSDMQRRLDPAQFVRIHRSTMIRRTAITEYRKDAFGLQACLASGVRLRVGRIYAKTIRQELAQSEKPFGLHISHA